MHFYDFFEFWSYLSSRPGIEVLGPPRSPRTRIPGAWGLPQGPQPIFLTFLTFMTFMTYITFMTFLTFWSFLRFRPGMGVLGPPRSLPRASWGLARPAANLFDFYDFYDFCDFFDFYDFFEFLELSKFSSW